MVQEFVVRSKRSTDAVSFEFIFVETPITYIRSFSTAAAAADLGVVIGGAATHRFEFASYFSTHDDTPLLMIPPIA